MTPGAPHDELLAPPTGALKSPALGEGTDLRFETSRSSGSALLRNRDEAADLEAMDMHDGELDGTFDF